MERNSEFTGEFTYDIDSGSDEDFTEDYGPQDKRTSGFHKRVSNMKNRISQGIRKMSTRPPGGDDGSDTASETVDLTDYEIDEFEEERPDMCQNRCDKHSQKFVKELVESRLFNIIMTVTILINTLFLIFEVLLPTSGQERVKDNTGGLMDMYRSNWVSYDILDAKNLLKRMDSVFLSIYLIEFLLKCYVSPLGYWKIFTNKLDFFILFTSFAQVIIEKNQSGASSGSEAGTVSSMRILRTSTNVKLIKTLRAFRALRTLKTLALVRGAQVIFAAILRSQYKSIRNVISLLACFIVIMSIFTYALFYETQPENICFTSKDTCNAWGCWSANMVTLFMIVTCDGWYEVQEVLDRQFSSNPTMMYVSRIVIIFIIIIGHFIMFNIFVAINIMQVSEANQEYNEEIIAEREAILQRKKDKILQRQYDDVKKLREEQEARGCSFYQMIDNFKNTLKHEDYTLTEDIITDIEWMENYIFTLDMLDNTTYKLQQLFFEYTNCLIYAQNEELDRRIGT